MIPRVQETQVQNFMKNRHGFSQEENWNNFINDLSDNHIIQMEQFLIRNYIKKNFNRIIKLGKQKSFTGSQKRLSRKSLSTKKLKTKRNFAFMKDVNLGTFLIDLGTIIAGNFIEKTIQIKNIGKN
jgi:subtilisin-like proprotein convertase family protein